MIYTQHVRTKCAEASVKQMSLQQTCKVRIICKEKRKETQRFDKSHIGPDHPRCTTPTKVIMWGGVPDVVNYAKFHQNQFRGFGSLRGRNLQFSYAWCYGLCHRL